MFELDAIVLGAGAAGLFCAAEAGKRGRRVLVLDHADAPGKKILISGGGRCNFTNVGTVPERFLSANRHFARSALSRYTPRDFIELVDSYGIAWHEKTLGQLFCDGSARQIVAMLMDEVERGGGEVRCDHTIGDVTHADGRFTVTTQHGSFTAPALVLATGGPSIPKMGATGFAYDLARQFGLKVVEPRPALVPLTLSDHDILFRELSGVASEVNASAGGTTFREAALMTHHGLSGPAILQASSYWRHGEPLVMDFLPEANAECLVAAKQETPKASLSTALRSHMPQRLATALAERLKADRPLGDTRDKDLRALGARLKGWQFHPNGTEGFAKAEVTIGGISTAELSSKTMEVKSVPGLFAIGECVDVTGWLGGYNFQWAWASGFAAGGVV